ncbi:MAG TPA: glycoside hydrolase family 36 protein [Candidatus Binataceae bacterium]|nr:glycoside hydrolase family 36 protein [Candidatus Binataceae bacterium]
MNLSGIEIRYRHATRANQSLAIAHPPGTLESAGRDAHIGVAIRCEYSERGVIARATVENLAESPVELDAVCMFIASGFDRAAPTRFLKHGYQSWSGSFPLRVGDLSDQRYQKRARLTRVNHQSEMLRPPDVPEAATSELFTILERSDGERLLAGFLEGATSLTTLTVRSPDAIAARALLDRIELAPGARRAIAPLYLERSREPAAVLAARWAAKLGEAMGARTRAPFRRGWCSWYHYFHAISEEALRDNLQALAALRSSFPIEVVQLDDGFQSALGDWDETNQKFPSGLATIGAEIRAAGFEAGIWTAPFLAARDSHLMRDHPDWFIEDEDGAPLPAGYNPNWTRHDDKFAYALDPSHPALRDHLERLFRKLVHRFGYSYLKLDFLYAAAAEGLRHGRNWTRAETLRHGLAAIRAGAGEDAFILGCGCPLGAAVGMVDGMRIGPDVSPYWGSGGAGDPSTVHALDAIIARSFMHRRLWLNDPDCLMLRAKETQLSADERLALASVIAGSGGMLLISDEMSLLGEDEGRLFRDAATLALQMDDGAELKPIVAIDLLDAGGVRGLMKQSDEGVTAVVVNRGDDPARFPLVRLGAGSYQVRTLGGQDESLTGVIDLAPHSARVVRVNRR